MSTVHPGQHAKGCMAFARDVGLYSRERRWFVRERRWFVFKIPRGAFSRSFPQFFSHRFYDFQRHLGIWGEFSWTSWWSGIPISISIPPRNKPPSVPYNPYNQNHFQLAQRRSFWWVEWFEEKIGLVIQEIGTTQNPLKMPCSGKRVLLQGLISQKIGKAGVNDIHSDLVKSYKSVCIDTNPHHFKSFIDSNPLSRPEAQSTMFRSNLK